MGAKLRNFYKSIWLFPALCLVTITLLTALKISGSSIGIYYKDLYGSESHDPNLIAGTPRSIRSDEWEVQSNMTVAQAKASYPRINKNIGDGQDMEIIMDVPYKDWSVIFKPQNIAFFILPFEFAFAFKWWLLALLLVLGVYFFVLLLLPKRRLWAALLGLSMLFSPFIQWWYQSITILPIAYSLLIVVVIAKLWVAKQVKVRFLWTLLSAYLLSCFAIILYPPFQIPCVLATAIFLLGYFLEKGYFKDRPQLLHGLKYCALSLGLFLVVTGSFLLANKAGIKATQGSVYPGKRTGVSGHFDGEVFMANFLDSQLQFSRKAKNYVANQSEASNFLLLAPFLSIPSLYFLAQQKYRKNKLDWPLLLTTALFLLFMMRLFVPGSDLLFKPLLLGSVPNTRLLIGIGLLGFLQLVLLIRHILTNNVKKLSIVALVTGFSTLLVNIVIGLLTRHAHPGYIHLLPVLIILAVFPAAIVYCLLRRKITYGLILLALFSLGSAGMVHPFYRGTGPLPNSELVHKISTISQSNPSAHWVVVDSLVYENIPALANVPSITGVYAYPQNEFWQRIPTISSQSDIYNRFAHTLADFTADETKLNLEQPDFFEIKGSPCSALYRQENVKFFLAEKNYSEQYPCLSLRQAITYPNKTFYILQTTD